MKKSVLFFVIIGTLFFSCKKEENLSGTWTISFKDIIAIDSIDASGKVYFNPYSMSTYTFDLISLNKENTLYQQITKGPPGMFSVPSYRIDTVKVELNGTINMMIFDNMANWGFGNQNFVANFSGLLRGYELMEGNAHYNGIWFCRHCPSGSTYLRTPVFTRAIAIKK